MMIRRCKSRLTAFYSELNASPEERGKSVARTAFFAAELARAGAAVIAAPVAPNQQSWDAVQGTVLRAGGSGANFFHIHIGTPLEHCESTDRKGVYAKARSGEIKNFVGIDIEHETPKRSELFVDLTEQSVLETVHGKILIYEV
jgi:sulfate adenylyltransferase